MEEIGPIDPVGADFGIDTDRIDPEIAGPQLVVPVSNALIAERGERTLGFAV